MTKFIFARAADKFLDGFLFACGAMTAVFTISLMIEVLK